MTVEPHRLRRVIAVPIVGGLGALLAWGFSGVPPFGHFHGFYGQLLNAIALPQRHTTNVVTAVVFDYRGFDTLGEEFILFAAVAGVVLLLRGAREPHREQADDRVHSEAIRMFGIVMVGVVALLGLYLVSFGLVTPGGGFQGGVAIAAAVVVVYLSVGYRPWRRFGNERWLDPPEGLGAAAYVVVGIAALIVGTSFLHNLLGPGRPGTLLSGGSMSFLNWAVALEVAAASLVLYSEFLEAYALPHVGER